MCVSDSIQGSLLFAWLHIVQYTAVYGHVYAVIAASMDRAFQLRLRLFVYLCFVSVHDSKIKWPALSRPKSIEV